ncbi:MAG TPA: hypothetical protein VN914_06125, partial [Polyangia bacterium]|nr:hypothetical protein [Polyangia bacterium]
TVVVYEFPKLIRQSTLTDHASGVSYLAFTGDGSRLVTVDNANVIKIWNLGTGKDEKTVTLARDWGEAALSPAGPPGSMWLALSYNDGTGFVLMDLAASAGTMIAAEAGAKVFTLAFSPDGQKLAVGTEDGRMVLWNVADKQKPVAGPMLWMGSIAPVSSVFSPDGRFVAAGGSNGMFAAGDIKIAGITPPGVRGSASTESGSMSIDFSPDGRAVVVGGWRCGKVTFCRD